MHPPIPLSVGSGLLESVAQVAAIAGTAVLMLVVVALAGYAYRSLRGDDIEWPSDTEESDSEVSRGSDDDEWKYY